MERATVLIELDLTPTGHQTLRPRIAHVYISAPSPTTRRVVKRWAEEFFTAKTQLQAAKRGTPRGEPAAATAEPGVIP